MTIINKQNADEWVCRFLNGETDNTEEQDLYRFFAGKDVPRNLKKYKPMFKWYAGEMKEPLPNIKKQHKLHILYIRLSIAASILLVCGIGFGWYKYNSRKVEYSCFEGSYIIRDGKKITNIKEIMPEVQKTLQLAEQQEQKANNEIKKTPSDYVKQAEEDAAENNNNQPKALI